MSFSYLTTEKNHPVLLVFEPFFIYEQPSLSQLFLPQLQCCGASGPSSYGTQPLPSSCSAKGKTHARGCADAFREEFFSIKEYALVLGGIGATLLILLVSELMFDMIV